MLAQSKYIDFLLNTPRNYTGTHLAAHSPTISHDQVYRFLRDNQFSASQLRELVQPLLADSPEAFLLVDDRVQDKRYSPHPALRQLVCQQRKPKSDSPGWLDVFHHPEKQPVSESAQGNGLPGAEHAGATARRLEPGRRGAGATSAVCGEAVQAGCHRRQH
uniref:Transposase IS701-like DDE domain-containing protein n=1 Tax=Tanacetum cinerariifolium TaxID=118510 RepID=A0A699QY27_TANCI|nr:hypothetical protein [Tanacetum cinerariifolium]